MTAPLDNLLTAIRKCCLPGLWSQGVKLAREGAVFDHQPRGDSLVARVKAPGVPVAPTVTLYPADEEWTCDCGGKVDPCAHVAAAAIAISQGTLAAEKPETAPSAALPKASARLSYRLSQKDGTLRLERWVMHPDGREEPFKGSFPNKPCRILPTHEDLTLDRLLGARQFGVLPPDRIAEVFAALASAPDVRCEGQRTKISTELLLPRASVIDDQAGVALVIERDRRITKLLTAGVVLL